MGDFDARVPAPSSTGSGYPGFATASSAYRAVRPFGRSHLLQREKHVVSPTGLLVAGILIYGATLFTLSVAGVSSIRELEDLGRRDGLTGLPNRHAMHQNFAHESQASDEAALALIDLDGFKLVNDPDGPFRGDQVLRYCANLLKDVCGPRRALLQARWRRIRSRDPRTSLSHDPGRHLSQIHR